MDRLTAAAVFVAVAERGSFSGAAERLAMSRSMVTRYLAAMEDWAQARLLHRTTRRVSLTAAGEQALARCRELLRVAQDVAQPLAGGAAPELRGSLRVACAQSLAQEVLVAGLRPFLLRHPHLQLDLLAGSAAVDLVEDRIDLALRISNRLGENVIARRLGEVPSVVCAAPAYVREHGAPQAVQDLAGHNCLAYAYFGDSLWQFQRPDGSLESVAVRGSLRSDEALVLRQAALDGWGVAMLPRYAVQALLDGGQLLQLLPQAPPPSLALHGVYGSRRHLSPALRALLDHLVALFDGSAGAL